MSHLLSHLPRSNAQSLVQVRQLWSTASGSTSPAPVDGREAGLLGEVEPTGRGWEMEYVVLQKGDGSF